MPKKFDGGGQGPGGACAGPHADLGSVTATAGVVRLQLGINEIPPPRWVNQDDVHAGRREGVPTEVQAELPE